MKTFFRRLPTSGKPYGLNVLSLVLTAIAIIPIISNCSRDVGDLLPELFLGDSIVFTANNPSGQVSNCTGDTIPPVINATNPGDGQNIAGNFTLGAMVSDDNMDRVEYYIDSVLIGQSTDSASYYPLNIDTTLYADGTHSMEARAIDFGCNSVSLSINFIIDNTLPSVSIVSPLNNATINGSNVIVKVSASDSVGIKQVDLYADGFLVNSITASPYDFTYDLSNKVGVSVQFSAVASDIVGNTITSQIITILVDNQPVPGINGTVFYPNKNLTWNRCLQGQTWDSQNLNCQGGGGVAPFGAATYFFCASVAFAPSVPCWDSITLILNGTGNSPAYDSCNTLNTALYGGKIGWRAPTRFEIESIILDPYGAVGPTHIDAMLFPDNVNDASAYHGTSEFSGNGTFVVDFSNGGTYNGWLFEVPYYYRCVTGQ